MSILLNVDNTESVKQFSPLSLSEVRGSTDLPVTLVWTSFLDLIPSGKIKRILFLFTSTNLILSSVFFP